LENLSDDEDISRAWENIKENIKTSTTGVSFCTKRSSIHHVLMKNVYIFQIKGSGLKCSGYRIQAKTMLII